MSLIEVETHAGLGGPDITAPDTSPPLPRSSRTPASNIHPQQRVVMYRAPHKGLRFLLSNLLVRMGATSFTDPGESAAVVADLDVALWACDAHIEHEDRHLRPALAERAPNAVATLDDEHVEHARQVSELRSLASALTEATTSDARASIGNTLYLQYSAFVAETLAHMGYEERVVQTLMDRLFSTQELLAIHNALVGSIPPHEMTVFLRGIIPGSSKEERAEMLGNAKANAPHEAFAAVMNEVRGLLSADDYSDLVRRLGL